MPPVSQTREWARAPCAGRGNAIARDAGLIVHDGDLATDQAIEQRRLADVRSADYRDVPAFDVDRSWQRHARDSI